MVRLKNIMINNKTASADFYPEDSEVAGHMVVDIESGEIVQLIKVDSIGWGISHVKRELIRMARENSKDTERLVMWY